MSKAIENQKARLIANPSLIANVEAVERLHGVEVAALSEAYFVEVKVRDIKQGEYVRKTKRVVGAYPTMQKKTYIRGAYSGKMLGYELIDCDDANRIIYVKGNSYLAIGFTY